MHDFGALGTIELAPWSILISFAGGSDGGIDFGGTGQIDFTN